MCYNSHNSRGKPSYLGSRGRLTKMTFIPRITHTRLRRIVAVLCLAACLVSPGYAAAQTAKLTILYTNDVHGHLFPFDYSELGKQSTDVGGAARRATLIRQMKSEAQNPVLVMDAGDVFNRGPLDNLKGVPDFAVMNAVPYDVMAPGNNEFKGAPGPEAVQILIDRAKEARFPVLCANVFDAATGKRLFEAYKVFDLAGVKVAVLGLLTTDDSRYPQSRNLRIDDPIATAKQIVPELRKQADVVIALTHVGVAQDLELASSVSGIDAIIGGHSHTWLYQPLLVRRGDASPSWAVGGTLVCQDGEWGRAVGRLDMELRSDGERGYLVSSYSGKLVDVDASITPAADVAAIVDKAAAPYRTVVGTLAADVKVDKAADWVAARMRDAAGSQIGVEPCEEVGQGLHSGKVTALDIRSMFGFVNQVVSIKATSKQLAAFLISMPDTGLAGASLVDGSLYVGGKKANGSRLYTVAIEEYYATHSPALASCPLTPLRKTVVEIIGQYLSSRSRK